MLAWSHGFSPSAPLAGGGDAFEDACIPKGEADFGIISRLCDGEFQMGFDWRVDGGFFFLLWMLQFWSVSGYRIFLSR